MVQQHLVKEVENGHKKEHIIMYVSECKQENDITKVRFFFLLPVRSLVGNRLRNDFFFYYVHFGAVCIMLCLHLANC